MKLTPNVIEGPIESAGFNPYEYIDLVLQQDLEAFALLHQHCIPHFSTIYQDYELKYYRISFDDWTQDCALVLWECIFNYRNDISVPFYAYLRTALQNKAMSLLRTCKRKNGNLYGTDLSLDQIIEETGSPYSPVKDRRYNELLMDKIEAGYIQERLEQTLNEQELAIFRLFVDGYSLSETARMLGTTVYFVRKALDKGRQVIQVDTAFDGC